MQKESLPPPFIVSRLPPNFSFGEICEKVKQQPFCEVDRDEAVKSSARGTWHTKLMKSILVDHHHDISASSSSSSSSTKNDNETEESQQKQQKEEKQEKESPSSSSSALKLLPSFPSKISYHILHTGNFVRVATMPGRLYWVFQNSLSHKSPDWKLHCSVHPDDVPIAWNLCVLPVFFEHPSISIVGMKAVMSAELIEKKVVVSGQEKKDNNNEKQQEEKEENTTTENTATAAAASSDEMNDSDVETKNKKEQKEKEHPKYRISTGQDEKHWPVDQFGREITIYLFGDDEKFEDQFPLSDVLSSFCESFDSIWQNRDDVRITENWRSMLVEANKSLKSSHLISLVTKIQQRFDFYGIRTSFEEIIVNNNNNNNNNSPDHDNKKTTKKRTTAVGDLPLTKHCSLRNEAYTNGKDVFENWKKRYGEEKKVSCSCNLCAFCTASSASVSSSSSATTTTRDKEQEEDIVVVPSHQNDTTNLYPLNDWGFNAANQKVPHPIQQLVEYFNPKQKLIFDENDLKTSSSYLQEDGIVNGNVSTG